ncbi:hypothetical protein J121_1939 [Qipengyuania citrea LAMA 915]|uniref:Uncharacterized protein n=1 Tax=Qipengyuania citrea LAMA 915 TaxID=1306953 RepID=A0A0L1KHC5_9SPHN|nr:hypothetical protein J121_1939 [Qipengyuania citrea LAMA 915]
MRGLHNVGTVEMKARQILIEAQPRMRPDHDQQFVYTPDTRR